MYFVTPLYILTKHWPKLDLGFQLYVWRNLKSIIMHNGMLVLVQQILAGRWYKRKIKAKYDIDMM